MIKLSKNKLAFCCAMAAGLDTGDAYQVAYATNHRAKTKGSKLLKQAQVLKQIERLKVSRKTKVMTVEVKRTIFYLIPR